MAFLSLPWRKQTWTFSRPGTLERNGLERATPGATAAVLCSTSAITESFRRSRPGTSAKLALRLRTEDLTADIRRGDVVSGTWPFPGPGGQPVQLHVDSVTPFDRHRRIVAVDNLEE
jgi:hypothetical protein